MSKTEYVILNIRKDLTKKTRDRIKEICRKKKITYGKLLEETFSK